MFYEVYIDKLTNLTLRDSKCYNNKIYTKIKYGKAIL